MLHAYVFESGNIFQSFTEDPFIPGILRPSWRPSLIVVNFLGRFRFKCIPPLASFLATVARASEWIDSLNYMFARRGNKAPPLSAKAESDNSNRTSCLLRLLFLSFPANQDSRPKDKGTLAQALLIPAHIWTKYELRPFFWRTFSYNLQIQCVSFLFQRALMVTLSVPPLSVPRVYRRDKLYLDWRLWFVCFFKFFFYIFMLARLTVMKKKKHVCLTAIPIFLFFLNHYPCRNGFKRDGDDAIQSRLHRGGENNPKKIKNPFVLRLCTLMGSTPKWTCEPGYLMQWLVPFVCKSRPH